MVSAYVTILLSCMISLPQWRSEKNVANESGF
jgi:hypothetical protein